MSFAGLIAFGIVGFWLALTLPYQYTPWSRRLSRMDLFGLLPRWTFFAPNPATRDLHLVVRDKLKSGVLTGWREIQFSEPRNVLEALWHPSKRPRKAVGDAAHSLKAIAREREMWLPGSLPYLMILNCCLNGAPTTKNVIARQFAIVETTGRKDRILWILYSSQFHPL